MKHLEQAYGIAGSELSTTHPLTFAGRIAIANALAETNSRAAATEFAAIDAEMLRWVYLQVFYAGNRDVVETMRAMADDMLHDYAVLAEQDPAVVAAFADAARRWPSLSSADNDNVLKLARLIDSDDTATAAMLAQISRLSRASLARSSPLAPRWRWATRSLSRRASLRTASTSASPRATT